MVPHYRGEKAEAAEGHAQAAREALPMRGVR